MRYNLDETEKIALCLVGVIAAAGALCLLAGLVYNTPAIEDNTPPVRITPAQILPPGTSENTVQQLLQQGIIGKSIPDYPSARMYSNAATI